MSSPTRPSPTQDQDHHHPRTVQPRSPWSASTSGNRRAVSKQRAQISESGSIAEASTLPRPRGGEDDRADFRRPPTERCLYTVRFTTPRRDFHSCHRESRGSGRIAFGDLSREPLRVACSRELGVSTFSASRNIMLAVLGLDDSNNNGKTSAASITARNITADSNFTDAALCRPTAAAPRSVGRAVWKDLNRTQGL